MGDSFADYVASRGHALTRMAYLLTGDHAAAEDLVQAALASAFARWRRIEAMQSPDAYVRRMIVNQHVSWWRRHRREQLRAAVPDVAVPDFAGGQAVAEAVRAAVRALPRRQRAALVLRYYEDLPDAEVAAVLGCSPGTVRSQLTRALAALRRVSSLTELVNPRGE